MLDVLPGFYTSTRDPKLLSIRLVVPVLTPGCSLFVRRLSGGKQEADPSGISQGCIVLREVWDGGPQIMSAEVFLPKWKEDTLRYNQLCIANTILVLNEMATL